MRKENVLLTGSRLTLLRANVVNAAFVFGMACAGPAFAKDVVGLVLDVTYLAAPTDWCPADAGVPMTVKMDGPDIIRGPSEVPRKVLERRGGSLSITHIAENTASFNRSDAFEGPNAEVIGRFSAEFQACFSAIEASLATGTWSVTGPDGREIATGVLESEPLGFPLSAPFFQPVSGPVKAYYTQIGDQLLFTPSKPDPKTSQTFLAEPDKE